MRDAVITRRQVLVGASCLAVGIGGGLAVFAFPRPVPALTQPASLLSELTLRLADGFRRQTWTYGGQTWDERRDIIDLFEGEGIRLTLINDTGDAVELTAAGPFTGAILRAGETKSAWLRVNAPGAFDLQAISHGEGLTKACSRILRRFVVRAGERAPPAA